MRIQTTIAGLAATALLLAGCTSGTSSSAESEAPAASPPAPQSSAPAEQSPAAVALDVAINHPWTPFAYWDTEACGVVKAAKEDGGSADRQAPANIDTAEQVAILQAQALKDPDAFVINTIDPDGMRQEIESLIGQGKLVVTVAEDTKFDGQVTNIISDQREAGKLALETLSDAMGGSGKVLIVDYQKGVASTDLRTVGFQNALADYPGIEVSSVEYATEASKASDVVSAALIRDPDIKGIFATSTIGGDGVINALRAAGKTDSIPLVTIDFDEKTKGWLDEGSALALIAQRPEAIGRAAYKVLEGAANGQTFPEQIFLEEPFVAITKDNVDANIDLMYRTGCNA